MDGHREEDRWAGEIPQAAQGSRPVRSAHLDAVRTGQAGAGFGVHGYSPKRLRAYAFSEFPLTGEDAVATSVAFQRTHDRFFKGKGYYKGVHL